MKTEKIRKKLKAQLTEICKELVDSVEINEIEKTKNKYIQDFDYIANRILSYYNTVKAKAKIFDNQGDKYMSLTYEFIASEIIDLIFIIKFGFPDSIYKKYFESILDPENTKICEKDEAKDNEIETED